ncbi:mitochondrial sodium/calcium exchanger protein-like isoform X1 [Rhodnius prolixus]|uniref:mitochondrial sodium/calcium exchanger protein-like isoform X1 n=1 Tax=Rhodnius prolixus TaxID=13249 RepID=UPI003D18A383
MTTELTALNNMLVLHATELELFDNSTMNRFAERVIQCRKVYKLPKHLQCAFVKSIGDCELDKIPVYKWLYCDYTGGYTFIGVIITSLVLASLFIILSACADNCVVPCIGTIATKLRMSDTLAGVTVLAFGNGAPDVFTALASKMSGLSQVFYTGIAGGCMFVTTFVAGSVLLIHPFQLDGWPFLRDIIFLLIAYLIIFTCFSIGVLSLHMCLTFIALYMIYIAIVLLGQYANMRYVKMKLRDQEKSKQSTEQKLQETLQRQKSIYSQYLILREQRFSRGVASINELTRNKQMGQVRLNESMWQQLYRSLLPFTVVDWAFMPWYEKALNVLQAPVSVVLKLAIPVCNLQQPQGGWCKLLVCINMCVCLPVTFFSFSDVTHEFGRATLVYNIPNYVFISLPGLIAAVLILFFTKVDKAPRGNWILAFIGFPIAIVVVNFACQTVVLVLESLGTRFGVSYSTLGMTLLAWGNSLGDLVSNTTLAKNGMPKMALAACFGSPLFTCIFGAGIASLASLISSSETIARVHLGLTGSLVSYFVFASLICSLFTLTLMDMDGRRSYGCFLITLYGTFVIMVLIAELCTEKRR